MPTLQFKGKNIIWNHHLSVPYHALEEVSKLHFQPEKASGNTIIGDVRGLGPMLAIEVVKDKGIKEYATDMHDSIIQKAFSKGLLLLGCGRSAIRFCPPLILTKTMLILPYQYSKSV